MGEGRKEEEMHVLMQLQAQNEVGTKNRPQVREISQFHDNMGHYCLHNKKKSRKKKRSQHVVKDLKYRQAKWMHQRPCFLADAITCLNQ
jgi:hypothetical protein